MSQYVAYAKWITLTNRRLSDGTLLAGRDLDLKLAILFQVILESNRRNDTLCDIMKRRKDADFDKFWNILWKDQEDLVLRCIPDFQPKGVQMQ